jgi:flagellar basal body-associated protein FliL
MGSTSSGVQPQTREERIHMSLLWIILIVLLVLLLLGGFGYSRR